MKNVTFYKTSTGEITRTAVIDETMVDNNCLDGESWIEGHYSSNYYSIVDGSPTEIDNSTLNAKAAQDALINFRQMRDAMLLSSDWTQSNDSPLTDAKKAEWATYRQALRDLPANTTDPRSPTWPTPPT